MVGPCSMVKFNILTDKPTYGILTEIVINTIGQLRVFRYGGMFVK